MNVCGLKRRICYPEFIEFINNYDLFCVIETKLDDYDNVSIPGYTYCYQNRKQVYKKKSGGIGIFIRNNLSTNFEKINTDSDYVLWLKLNKQFIKADEDYVFGVLYVPPSQSKFLKDDEILALEMEILSISSPHKYVFLTGNINARTGKLQDFITVDTFFADFFEFENETLNFYNQAELLKNFDISVNRTSCDNVVNTNGSKLIEICRGNNLFIVNGRLGTDRDVGHFTYRNTSLIDFTICTLDALKLIHKFDVIETDTLFSDGHSALSWSVKIAHKIQDSNDKHSQERPVRWKPDKANSFVASINAVQIQNLLAETENMEINQDRINDITEKNL